MGLLAGAQSLLTVQNISKKSAHEFFQKINNVKSLKPSKQGLLGFFEPSTRTRASFESAGLDLGLRWINVDPGELSLKKGESLRDTFQVFAAYPFSVCVVRHSMSGFAAKVAEWTQIPTLNAGDGMHEHPTQALADAYTLWKRFKAKKLKVILFGDVFRSRVARSNVILLKALGHQVAVHDDETSETRSFAAAYKLPLVARKNLSKADVVMALRVQSERGSAAAVEPLGLRDLGAKTSVMHPGPVIVNQDIQFDVLETQGERNLILDQVQSGYLVRRRLLAEILGVAQ